MKQLIETTDKMNTVESLSDSLKQMGVQVGKPLLVHSSLSALGWTNGGSVAVIQALIEVVTEEGTLVMPTQSGDLSDPKNWQSPAVPKEWWEEIRSTMPTYDPDKTPTCGMGQIAELFRTWPGVIRSGHPSLSFAAWGKSNAEIMADHPIAFGLGEASPLAKLYDADAYVLFLGTQYDTNTCFHLGEYRAPSYDLQWQGAPVTCNGQSQWMTYRDIIFAEEEFSKMGNAFEQKYEVVKGQVGQAETRLFSLRQAVDFSTQWFTEKRKG
ncbi:AAC(3) family N-acetyltransferase [Salipaludibacillus agaradhaerens]|uniref:aminoglycoside N(3)-acetyltransferase n=1 Tax=Salipaludibacillus agaradhaerens TaxID=76935 RepID=UPI002150745F|nr:AAC(3) family N-acetyltransferase [Salipaludibacillus agaradhaerens]MCR6105159.1 AAC(3) family N-acetyltransferase [Salipaludibacillus agaradhaerens]MCR6117204.1 AAC(3) family N-acetyltransferase [Salipaludibacillus agaradhaerens]